jgi:hypothetical protein
VNQEGVGMAEYYYSDDPESKPSPTARRMQRYRRRVKKGDRCFTIVASARFLDALVKAGFLRDPARPEDITDEHITEAVYALMNAWRNRGN